MDEKNHNDIKLWESFLKGDTMAFEKVYRRFYPILYTYGLRMIGNRELVTDTIQDLFVKLILNCKHLHPTDNLEAYLLSAFRNKLLDAVKYARQTETIDLYQDLFAINEDVIQALFEKDDKDMINERRLAKGIASLSARQREILYLYYIKELSYKEIAIVLGMNLQSCRNLLSRTLAHLREFFYLGLPKCIFFFIFNHFPLFY